MAVAGKFQKWLSAFFLLLICGCSSLPKVEGPELIERVKSAYGQCSSFKESGTIEEIETEAGQKRATSVRYSIEFIRGGPFRMELHASREHDSGPYAVVFYNDGGHTWSVYDSLRARFRAPVITTNVSEATLVGAGVVLS